MNVIETHRLGRRYGGTWALRDCSLTIPAGHLTALVGPNGAGKSTTLNAAVGVLPTMDGEVLWRGEQRPKTLTALARHGLAFVPEGRSVISGLTVQDNLRLGKGGVEGALGYFPELERLLARPAGLLSGGEQQMLSLGRALATEPVALLADEVSLGLAPIIVDQVAEVIQSLRGADRAILIAEQRVDWALDAVDRGVVIENGSVTTVLSPDTRATWLSSIEDLLGLRLPGQ